VHDYAQRRIVEGMHRIGIVGASGYTGAELLRLLAAHPELEVAWATGDTQAGNRVAALYPSLGAAYPSLTFSEYDPAFSAGKVARSRPSAAGISRAPNRPWKTRKVTTAATSSGLPKRPSGSSDLM